LRSKSDLRARLGRTALTQPRLRTFAAVAAVIGTLAAPSVAGAVTLVGSGSSAAQPYMLELFRAYSKLHKRILFKYNPDGGNAGVKDVQSGHSQFAINTRPPSTSLDGGTTYVKLFLDGLCIAVNKANKISNISLGTVKNIFLGVDTNWDQVPGSNLNTTIDPIGRNSLAGQYTFFQQAVLGGATQAGNVAQDTSDGLVQIGVEKDKSSIGYVGLAHSQTGVKRLTIGGQPCDQAAIRARTYPLLRYDWGVLPSSDPNPLVEEFFAWVRSSAAAGKVINQAGAVAAFNK
jgi:phosphate transport system substrate-binding protein